jgi:sugar lactone lactonase YvrE
MHHYRWGRVRRSLMAITPLAIGLLVAVPLGPEAAAIAGPEFDAPSGLAYGGGHLWVANQANNSVTEVDPSTGAWIKTIRKSADGFDQPTAIIDVGADLFVVNGGGSVTELLAQNGSLVGHVSGPAFGFDNPVAVTVIGSRLYVLNAGQPTASPAVPGSVTIIDAGTRNLLGTISGSAFSFDDPTALTTWQHDLFVTDEAANAVTEIDTTTNSLIKVITDPGLSQPDGIAAAQGHAWVADSASSATTEIDVATATVLGTFGNADGDYGFSAPSITIANKSNVFIASPFGTSPMVTRLSATTGAPKWYMCNTNGPYYFSDLSAFAFVGDHLWVASRSGANNPFPDAATGSLTELYTTSGALITTLPTT